MVGCVSMFSIGPFAAHFTTLSGLSSLPDPSGLTGSSPKFLYHALVPRSPIVDMCPMLQIEQFWNSLGPLLDNIPICFNVSYNRQPRQQSS